ncbi:hypothetical protein MKEN_00839900 [Mycena kentingensis (nom. inval.)]|nr:hypothetical protein MKEN_00839900 [Mycena kentingensis (nom. inval.)]
MDLELEDEDVRIAVRALGAMRHGGKQPPDAPDAYRFPPPAVASPTRSPPTPTAASSSSHTPALSLSTSSTHAASSPPHTPPPQDEDDETTPPGAPTPQYPSLVRMQSLPLVSGALRVYEAGKANSRVVQYTSSLVSSSLRHASSRLPAGSGERMDEFAGGMLDRLDWYRRPSAVSPSTSPPDGTDSYTRGTESMPHSRDTQEERVPGWLEPTSPFVAPPPPPPSAPDRGKRREQPPVADTGERQVAQRSTWQAMLLEAGGLSAALSDDSMRRLRYCLQWLQYATQHIDAQILILRDFIASLQPPPPVAPPSAETGAPAPAPPELTAEHLKTLAHLRGDIVHTIRQVVGVVSKYAGGALPEPARGRVRGFILDLPRKFGEGSVGAEADASGVASAGAGGSSARRRRERGSAATSAAGGDSVPGSPIASSAPGSPHLHVRPLHAPYSTHSRRASIANANANAASNSSNPTAEAGRAMAAARKVLTLATESLDMMRGVTAVVGESLDRADAWVDRLRTVGIQRGMDGLALPGAPGPGEHSPREMWSGSASPRTGNASARLGSGTMSGTMSPGSYVGAPSPGIGPGMGAMSLGEGEREGEGRGMEVDG